MACRVDEAEIVDFWRAVRRALWSESRARDIAS